MAENRTAFSVPPLPSGRGLDLEKIRIALGNQLASRRSEMGNLTYFVVLHVDELTREVTPIADCGLQRDIHRRISQGELSFNKTWKDALTFRGDLARFNVDALHSPLGRQLKTVFGGHPIERFGGAVLQVDEHDYLIFLEAHMRGADPIDTESLESADLRQIGELVYMVWLKAQRRENVSLWENAIHEIASPLDFIYSNSDFMLRVLTSAKMPVERKKKKLDDLKTIATLLINRLHQFRYAFSGTSNLVPKPVEFSLFDACMPITHLWYHEAKRKSLRFVYDGLKGHQKIKVDKELFQSVMFNLISNAIKYSDSGTEIILFAERQASHYKVGIRNQGIGVADGEKVFQPYYRAAAARKRDARGMGIGLAVCKQLMAVIGGHIRLEDPRPESTTFALDIPQE